MNKLFKGKIRNGHFGNFSDEVYEVLVDDKYGYALLDHFPQIDYESSSYRELVNNGSLAEDYFQLHDSEQAGYFSFISKHINRGTVVADCGCGGGSLLDLVKGMVSKTIGIEPYLGYHASLKERGHEVFQSVEKAVASDVIKPDIALSIQVIEHTYNPLEYLKNIFTLLNDSGKLILFTPNLNDVMLKLHFDIYAPFFFRTVHNYYFTAESLVKLGIEAGFKNHEILYYHDFGLDNAMHWLRDNAPKKKLQIGGIDKSANKFWKGYLESTGQSYNVGVLLSK
ncbi:MAG: class I SAM-dependent methyltransferase [Chitinophagaceae bacterium]|nr:class I SAM-dependent methyltransferase [Chitinophagaceae bacterium]